MNITDELREYADRFINNHDAWIGLGDDLADIADRIDAEYQKAEDEWKAKGGQSWLHGYEECHLELMEGNEAIAASLEEAGWVKLPLDADGVPIHIGDVMEPNGAKLLFGQTSFEVRAIRYDECGWEVYSRLGDRYAPSLLCHYHEPTVEDVLDEFASAYDRIGGEDEEHQKYLDLITEYAAKLQLRGDTE